MVLGWMFDFFPGMVYSRRNYQKGNTMDANHKKFGLTGNQLKILALLTMTVDHIGLFFIPANSMLYVISRIIGRLAMPIFAWMIAEGCRYTKNRLRYLLTLLGFGIFSQAIEYVFQNSLHMCILITFSLSVILIYTLDYSLKKKNFCSLCLLGGIFLAICYACVFLPGDIPYLGFDVDYGIYGVLLPVLIYIGRNRQEKLLLAAIGLVPMAIYYGWIQWFSLGSLLLLALYNGQRGRAKLKYLFYIYYPAHIGVFALLAVLLTM